MAHIAKSIVMEHEVHELLERLFDILKHRGDSVKIEIRYANGDTFRRSYGPQEWTGQEIEMTDPDQGRLILESTLIARGKFPPPR